MGTAANPRGTSNSNRRGGSETRRRRREWLVKTYRSDTDVVVARYTGASPDREDLNKVSLYTPRTQSDYEFACLVDFLERDSAFEVLNPRAPTCRCYRCGLLLTVEIVTVDRIIEGTNGGTYRRNNIRPACLPCNSKTGGALAKKQRGRNGKK